MTSSPDDAQRIRLLAIELAQSGPFLAGTDIGEFRERLEQALLAAEKRGEDRERERCAKIAEAVRAKAEVTYGDGDDDYIGGEYHAADRIAAAIRSSGGGNG